MKNMSDIIEQFILQQMLDDSEISLSRNELAGFFNCAPSQINYVLTTRFTPLRGFDIESKRGGGGFIKVNKIVTNDKNVYLQNLLHHFVGEQLDYNAALQLLDNLKNRLFITQNEYNILKTTLSDKSLMTPFHTQNMTRAKMMKNIILSLLKEE